MRCIVKLMALIKSSIVTFIKGSFIYFLLPWKERKCPWFLFFFESICTMPFGGVANRGGATQESTFDSARCGSWNCYNQIFC